MGDSQAHIQAVDPLDGVFASRPDWADQGTNAFLLANYFEMVFENPKLDLYVYNMSFAAFPPKDLPPSDEAISVPDGKKLVQVVRCALATSTFDKIKSDIATDFSRMLISCRKLESSQMQTGQFKFWAENENENGVPKPRKHAIRFQMILEHKHTLCLSELVRYLASGTQGRGANGTTSLIVQALEIILGHHGKLSLQFVTPKQGKCFPKEPTGAETFMLENPGYLQGVRGFFASVRATTNRTLVNCNACYGAFYKPTPLVNLYKVLARGQKSFWEVCKRFESAIQGMRVEITHLRDDKGGLMPSNRTIFGLARPYGGPKEVSFYHQEDDKTYTVADYWQRQGYERIQDFDLPVINVGDKHHPIFVPLHVCNIISGQMSKKKLNSIQTSDMIKLARREPEQTRIAINTDAFRVLGLEDNAMLKSFGISVKTDMIRVRGRVLRQPTIIYKTAAMAPKINDTARWDLRDQNVFRSGDRINWAILAIAGDVRDQNLHGNFYEQRTRDFFRTFEKTVGNGKVDAPTKSWPRPLLKGDEAALKQAFEHCLKNDIRLLMVVLPDKDASTYNQIKTLGDIEYGIHTVCVLGMANKFYGTSAQYSANVALKINLKLGGANHKLLNQISLYKKTMVIGIDVTHPSPGPTKRTAPSVAAMVASTDSELAQWPVDLRINTAGQEMVDLLGPMLRTRLELWKSKHQESLPENLLIYRDGVSESQYPAVLQTELQELRNTCKLVYTGRKQPRITLIIVGKRHHTRFFKIEEGHDLSTNPRFGTVVDTTVTEARNWDFFLQSHHALLGTARPAHYFVLLNEIFTEEFVGRDTKVSDYLHKLTYDMCYLFGRSTVPVSIPPPVYYADLACERSRCYGDFDDDFSDTSSIVGDDRGKSQGGRDGAQLPYRGQGSRGQTADKPGPSSQKSSAQTPGEKEDLSKKQLRSTAIKTPDLMAGMTKKERARLFEEKTAAASQRAAAGSSKAEGKKPDPGSQSSAKAESRAAGKLPEAKSREKSKEGKAKEDTQSKAQGKKPEKKREEQKPESQAEEKRPKEKAKVEIHDRLKDTMFYI